MRTCIEMQRKEKCFYYSIVGKGVKDSSNARGIVRLQPATVFFESNKTCWQVDDVI